MHPYLPVELVENIVEQVEDQNTLAACSLTCRTWASIAQSKYFSRIHFSPSLDKTTRFLEVIRESPHIALLPRSIRSYQWDVGDEDGRACLAQIASLLVNVSSLCLEGVRLGFHSSQKIVGAFPALQELQFYGCDIDLGALSSFFQSHPTLRTLSFHLGVVIQVNPDQELLPLVRLQHLRVFCTEDISRLIPLLIHHEAPLAPVELLGLDSLRPSDNANACTLLFGLRHTLRVLEIGASYFQDKLCSSDELIKRFPLEHLTTLREFKFTGIVFDHRTFHWVNPLLQKLQTNTSVEALRFQMWFSEVPHAQHLGWDTMRTILIAMPCLQIVEFMLWGGDSVTEMRSVVRQKLGGIEKECTLKLSGQLD